MRVLVGIEAEILPTGEVLLADREGMDIVLASYHAAPSEEAYYRAVFRAMEDPRVDVLAHHAWSAGMRFGSSGSTRSVWSESCGQRQSHRDQRQALPPDVGLPGHVPGCGVRYTIGSDAHKVADVGSVAWANNTARHIFKDQGLFVPESLLSPEDIPGYNSADELREQVSLRARDQRCRFSGRRHDSGDVTHFFSFEDACAFAADHFVQLILAGVDMVADLAARPDPDEVAAEPAVCVLASHGVSAHP